MEQPITDLIERRVAVDDRARVSRLIAASRAANTTRAYRSRLIDYERWCRSRELEMDDCLTDEHVAAYIGERHAGGMSARTLSLAVAALRFAAKNAGLPDEHVRWPAGPHAFPAGHLAVAALNGAKRIDANQPAPLPTSLRRDQLDRVLELIDHERREAEPGSRQEIAALRDAALLSLAADCLLRVSELAGVDVEHLRVERVGDGLDDEDTARLFVPRSKTDQEGRGEILFVPPRTLGYVLDWLGAGDILEGPIARSVDRYGNVGRARIAHRYLTRIVRTRCEKAGFRGITIHGLRRGMAETLSLDGANTTEIMRAGRWRSAEMPARYTRATGAAEGAVARFHRQRRLDGRTDDRVEAK